MYRGLSFYGKLISFILLVISMVIIKSYNIFLLVSGMIFIVSFLNKDKKCFFLSLGLFLLIYILEFNYFCFIVLRILLVIVYAFIIESSLLSLEKRYLYDKLLYRNRSSNKIREYVKKYYYDDLLEKNIESNKRIGKYLSDSSMYNSFLNRQARKKTSVGVDDLYLLDRIRFDRFYNKKKSKLTFSWNNYDNVFLSISLIIFVIVIVLGR